MLSQAIFAGIILVGRLGVCTTGAPPPAPTPLRSTGGPGRRAPRRRGGPSPRRPRPGAGRSASAPGPLATTPACSASRARSRGDLYTVIVTIIVIVISVIVIITMTVCIIIMIIIIVVSTTTSSYYTPGPHGARGGEALHGRDGGRLLGVVGPVEEDL